MISVIYIFEDGCCRPKERIRIYFKIRRSTKRFVFFEFIHFVLHTCYIYVCFQLVAFAREYVWHKAFSMGYSMRLELTLVSRINDSCLVRLVYLRVLVPLFLKCVYFGLLYPFLIFDMFILVS